MFSASSLEILYQDEHLLVIVKPAGLVVTTSETHKNTTLSEILQNELHIPAERGGIVHRLDKDTSGIMLVGKTEDMVLQLQSQFKNRTIKKDYLTLVHGEIQSGGKIDAPIARHRGDRTKFEVAMGGREAVTEYEVEQLIGLNQEKLEQIFEGFNKIQMRKLQRMGYGKFTLVRCHPLTGRTHQIRVHLKHIGHPLVSDEKYGGRKVVRLDKRWCPRQFLHATRLEFDHPVTNGRMTFVSELPEDLKKSLEYLS